MITPFFLLHRLSGDAVPADWGAANWLNVPENCGSWRFQIRIAPERQQRWRLFIAAIDRYAIKIDGVMAAENVLHHTLRRIFCDVYELQLSAGEHTLDVLLPDFRSGAPYAIMPLKKGFYLLAEGDGSDCLTTGKGNWRVGREAQLSFVRPQLPEYYTAEPEMTDDRSVSPVAVWDVAEIAEPGAPAECFRQREIFFRNLCVNPLPAFAHIPISGWRFRASDREMAEAVWHNRLEHGDLLSLPPHSSRRILIDFENYVCAGVRFRATGGGGALIEFHWAESLWSEPDGGIKEDRNRIEGKYFRGPGDVFLTGTANDEFQTFCFRCGCYVRLTLTTGDHPLQLQELCFSEDRYPLKAQKALPAPGSEFHILAGNAVRSLQMCAHDTLMDCPYYERLNYLGDGRAQLVGWYAICDDLALPRHVLSLWEESIRVNGVSASIYPARGEQTIPAFSLYFPAAVADFANAGGDEITVKRLTAACIRLLTGFELLTDEKGILHIPFGWKFIDWAGDWPFGCPPDQDGASGIFQGLLCYSFGRFAEHCQNVGEKEYAERFLRKGKIFAAAAISTFFDRGNGLFALLPGERGMGEHASLLMLASGLLPEPEGASCECALFDRGAVAPRSTPFFDCCYYEAAAKRGREDVILRRLREMSALTGNGLYTLPENPGEARSDCHAWSAHILKYLVL